MTMDSFFIFEARRMPFADASLPRAASKEEFFGRIRNAVAAMVTEGYRDYLPDTREGEDDGHDSQTSVVLETSIGRITAEMLELEGVYESTINRMRDIAEEEGESFEEEDATPPIAMKFDMSGRLLAVGTFPFAHGYHRGEVAGKEGR